MNFTSGVFRSEKEMELYQFRWAQVREKYLPLLREQGLVRYAGMQIWNKQGKTQMGWLFEYSDPEAYKRCQPIFKDIDTDDRRTSPRLHVSRLPALSYRGHPHLL